MSGKYVNLGKLKYGQCIEMQSEYWEGWRVVMVVDKVPEQSRTIIMTHEGIQFALKDRAAGVPTHFTVFDNIRSKYIAQNPPIEYW
jgi:hypothetical protein